MTDTPDAPPRRWLYRVVRAAVILSALALAFSLYKSQATRGRGRPECRSAADCGGRDCVIPPGRETGFCASPAGASTLPPCLADLCDGDSDCSPDCRCRKREGKDRGRCYPASATPPPGYVQGDPRPAP